MKKIICGLLCLMMFTFAIRVNASNITIEEVESKFNQTDLVNAFKELSEDYEGFLIDIDEENHKFNILDEDKDTHERETYMSFSYTDDYVKYEDRDTVLTAETDFLASLSQDIAVVNMIYAIIDASGNTDKFVDTEDETIFNEEFYNEYGLLLDYEDYDFSTEDETNKGNFLREFKMSLDKEKIAKLLEDYGISREDLYDDTPEVPEGLAPTLSASDVTSNSVALSPFVENAEDEDYMCNIYMSSTEDGEYELYDNVAYGCTFEMSITFDELTPNTTYYFKAKIDGGDTFSNAVMVKTLDAETPNLDEFKITSVGTKNVKLSWNKVSGAKGYFVYSSTNGKKWKKVATTKSSVISYNVKKLSPGKKYYFKVVAYKVVKKKNKTIVKSKVLNTKTKPVAPKFKVKKSTYNSVQVTVTKVTGASKYVIERSTDKKNYEVITELTKAGTYKDTNVNTGTKYYYRVKACNERCGSYSKVVNAKPSLKAPTIKVTSKTKAQAKITYKHVTGTEIYEIYRSTKKNGKYTLVGSENALQYVDETVKSKKTYYYKVRATVKVGEKIVGTYSKPVKVKVK